MFFPRPPARLAAFACLLSIALTASAQDPAFSTYALAFDGTDDYVEVANTAALEFAQGTVELWARPNDYTYAGTLIALRGTGGTRFSLHLNPGADQIGFWNNIAFNTVSAPIEAGTWYHIAFVFGASSTEVFVDGASVGTMPTTINTGVTGQPLVLGAPVVGSTAELFNGSLDEVRLWNTTRSQQQIQDNRLLTLRGDESGLVAYFPLEAGSGTTATDLANANNGTLDGPTWTTDDAPVAGQAGALAFDGTDDYVEAANTAALEFAQGTVELWARPNDYTYAGTLIALRGTGGTRFSLHLNPGADQIGFWNNIAFNTVSAPIEAGTWYHIAFVFGASSTEVFVDGASVGTMPTTINTGVTGQPLVLGAPVVGSTAELFNGSLDEVRLWNTTRSQQQIQDNRACQLIGTETGLVAYYDANNTAARSGHDNTDLEASGVRLTDRAASNNGTLDNFALTGTASNWVEQAPSVATAPCQNDEALTIHVDADATGANDGTSWADAYTSLQLALFLATSNDEVWIAEGTYQPDQGPGLTPGDRSLSFTVTGNQDGLKIYGGFAGTETDLSQRDVAANPVILSGDIGAEGDNADNSYHVLFFDGGNGNGAGADIAANVTTATLLDGVTVTGGKANENSLSSGGGLFCDGVGDDNECSPTLNGVTFHGNEASFGGGAFYGYGLSNVVVTNSVFYDNQAKVGGALFNDGFHGETTMRIVNSTFYGNRATSDDSGGALWINGTNEATGPTLANSIFYGNTSAGTSLDEIGLSFVTVTISNTLVEGGINGSGVGGDRGTVTDGGGNLDADPLFFNAADPDGVDNIFATHDDGLALFASSPAVDAGDNTAISGITTDLTGADRIQNGTVNMGAYEVLGDLVLTLHVDADATGANDGSSWANAFASLQDALAVATGNDEIWIAAGTYYPDDGANVTAGDRAASFTVTGNQDGLKIYGGFAGTETMRSQRDVAANPVILSGDIGARINIFDNSYHVFTFDGGNAIGEDVAANVTSATVLDGVAITGGKADAVGSTLVNDSGSGIYCDGADSGNACSPTLIGVSVYSNDANNAGAVLNNGSSGGDSSPTLLNMVFYGNSAQFGVLTNYGSNGTSSPTIINSTFTGTTNGGAIYSEKFVSGVSTPILINVLVYGNAGGTLTNQNGATPQISSSLIEGSGGSGGGWDNTLGTDGGGNLDADPLFLDAHDADGPDNLFGTTDDGLHLTASSPAHNAGDGTALPAGITTDVTGGNRTDGASVDIGAYEGTTVVPADPAQILRVAAGASGAGDGSSWPDAFPTLQDALAVATGNDEIWIAAGTYKPDQGGQTQAGNRFESFTVSGEQDGLQIYGGFAGTETQREQRDVGANPVLLSGDIGTPADSTDNSYHVFFFDGGNSIRTDVLANITTATILDGVTITEGKADGPVGESSGGGLACDGRGAGNSCSPTLSRLIFLDNTANVGGAIYTEGGSGGLSAPTLTNSLFVGNVAAQGGALFHSFSGNPLLTNNTFVDNSATFFGGAIRNNSANPTITNSIFSDNTSGFAGPHIWNTSSAPPISHTLIEGSNGSGDDWDTSLGVDGGNNLDGDPLFLDPTDPDGPDDAFATADDGFRITTGSPAANAGDNTALDLLLPVQQPLAPLAVTVDLTGADRIQDGTVDMGAYEGEATPLPIELVSFQARQTGRDALLQWATQSETHNAGFEVEWQTDDATDWQVIGYVPGAGTTTEAQSYRLTHSFPPAVAVIGTHRFRLKQLDLDGSSVYSAEVELTIGVAGTHEMDQVFPNPLRSQGRLRFAVGTPQQVRVEVYDVTGRRVEVLHEGPVAAHRTEEVRWRPSGLASGVYFVRVVGERFSDVQQVVLVK